MIELNKKTLKYILVIILVLMLCFTIDYDRKPHFQVIRGNYEEQITDDITDDRININTATVEELVSLDGIGPAIAERIVSYRAKTPFSATEDIMNVKGIGTKKYEAIKDALTVD